MNHKLYSQSELLNTHFENKQDDILEGLLKVGLYIFAGTSKIGKSLLTTSLANAVANGEPFLSKKTKKGLVLYFDNDNYDFEAKSRIKAQQFQENDNVLYNFDDSSSLYDIKEFIMGFSRINEVSLIIIDCLANLYEFSDVDNFSENYAMIKEFRDFIVNKNLCCVLTHHTKKGKAKLQDSVLGSKSLTSATTGTIIIETENEFSTTGTLNFILRSRKEKIPIKKDDYNINWVFNDSDDGDEFIDPNVLLIIKALAINESHCMKDNCQTLTAKMNLTINPKGLYRFLVKNKTILDENHIYFSKERNGHERLIKLEFSPEK